MQSLENRPALKCARQKYEDGVASRKFQDTGVKKLFILGLAQSAQENYENVFQLWSAIGINQCIGTIATDLKLANIMTGIMSHSSMFPCTWCVGKKDELSERSTLRTIGSISENHSNWKKSGGDAKLAKNYLNCIHEPVYWNEPNTLILDVIPPPELHLLLGVVNTVINHMLIKFEETTLFWIKFCNVERETKQSGLGFNGNACKKLLEKLDVLRSNCPINCLIFFKVLNDFHAVVRACFGKSLDRDYIKCIALFKKSYLDLGISVTPKVHAVFYHVEEFCTKHGEGLGFYSEQAVESVHHDFKAFWDTNKVHPSHSQYSEHLLKAVCKFNSLHV